MEIQLYIEHDGPTRGISREWLLCEDLQDGLAKVISVPFFGGWLSPGDTVLYEDKQIVGVLEKTGKTYYARIECVEPQDKNDLIAYFKRNNVVCEQLATTHFGFGVPDTITESEFVSIVANAPLKMEIYCE